PDCCGRDRDGAGDHHKKPDAADGSAEEIEKPDHPAETYYRLLELGATFFGYTLEYMLYKMSFFQLLTMIEVRNARERRAYEAAQAAAAEDGDGSGTRPPPMKDLNNPDNLPNVSDIQRMFGGMMG